VVLSPVFIPLCATYMTDVPGFFAILLCLYCCVRALHAKFDSRVISWLAVATIAGVIGGTCRQIVWLGPLVIVPSTVWLLRKKRGLLPAGVALWIFTIAAALACSYWVAHQPYALPEKIVRGQFERWRIRKGIEQYRDIILSIVLFCLPALVAYLTALRKTSKKVLLPLASLSALLIIGTLMNGGNGLAPFMIDIVSPWGFGGDVHPHTLGRIPVVLGPWIRLGVTCFMALALCVAIALVVSRDWLKVRSQTAPGTTVSWWAIFWLFVPFGLCYLVLLAPRAIFAMPFDRYVIPLFALLLIPLLGFYQEYVSERVPDFCFVVLALFALFGVASTHDTFAMRRARLAAVQEVLHAGVPRTELQAGFELDGEAQLDLAGYINDPQIQIPAGAYKPVEPSDALPSYCQTQWSQFVPAIRPRYFLVFSPQSCLASSGLPPVTYSAWWPPFRRSIYIQRLAEGGHAQLPARTNRYSG